MADRPRTKTPTRAKTPDAKRKPAAVQPSDSVSRDPAKPVEYYAKVVEAISADVAYSIALKAPQLLGTVSDFQLRIARAQYSAGYDVGTCLKTLGDAASSRTRLYTEGRHLKFVGLGTIEEYLESFAAACLTGRIVPLVAAWRGVTIKDVKPWEAGIMTVLENVLQGSAGKMDSAQVADLKKRAAANLPLAELLTAAGERDKTMMDRALEKYLISSWGPSADRAARIDLKAKKFSYTGKWCFFAIAVCQIAEQIPQLSSKAKEYFPVDLLAAVQS